MLSLQNSTTARYTISSHGPTSLQLHLSQHGVIALPMAHEPARIMPMFQQAETVQKGKRVKDAQ
ncbi:hypothetical protein P0996_23220, partial [Xanthomonas hortorum pv. gardneri]